MSVKGNRTDGLWASREGVLEEVKQIVAVQLSIAPEQIQESSQLEADLGCDSIDVVEITMEIEEHFDLTVPDDIGQQLRTIGDAVDGVMRLLGQNSPTP
ncbi:MAG: acyl carrier protein [Thermoguttaceae bacterium]